MNIRVGNTSWTDPALINSKRFYPSAATARRRDCASMPASSRWWRSTRATLHAQRKQLRPVGRAHTARIRVQHQGFPPVHSAPDASRHVPEGHATGTPTERQEKSLLQGQALGRPQGALVTVFRSDRAIARSRKARRRPLPVRALGNFRSRWPGTRRALCRHHRRATSDGSRISQPELVRRETQRLDTRFRVRKKTCERDRGRAARHREFDPRSLGGNEPRPRVGPPARPQPRDVEHQRRNCCK
ncbi:hypothetical protein C7402_10641 [Paraburkholderia unamae]|uniref:Uncharacterized protein n=1 Tax=Paraburkholderia unamae TaxID=219649 RepID=A0ABX5KQU3_9BURK|nr:hypothetical protein C7402_10641 [Paraburkholderia unamae]